jgi:predicted transcriptional regulator
MNAKQPAPPKPTPAELELLRVLWRTGPATARQVHEELAHTGSDTSAATVLRFLQIMHGKGLLTRDDSQRAHVYAPAHAPDSLRANLLKDFIQKTFGGSGKALVMAALRGHVSKKEREEIEALLRNKDGQ